MKQSDILLNELAQLVNTTKDYALAQQFAPVLRFDVAEPFYPLTVGYTIFREVVKSPSSKFTIDPAGGIAIEYAIWWDWDIQHLYELEHAWVYLDENRHLVRVEASAHGKCIPMINDNGSIPLENQRITLYSESGKHGFAPNREWLLNRADSTNPSCGEHAGRGGIHTSNPFGAEAFDHPTALEHRLAKRYMQRLAFQPTYEFTHTFDLRSVPCVTWEQLQRWIPRRIKWWRNKLPEVVPHLRVICLDSGDTLVDEATEIKDENEVVQQADLIPGANQMIRDLTTEGYTLALVADGPRGTFENILKHQYDLWDSFSAYAISGDVGISKPDKRMFLKVLDELNISQENYTRGVMVGNNLARDIKGANNLGLISIWINWSPRRSKVPTDKSEEPDYTISTPSELISLLETIELNLPNDNGHRHES